MKNMAFHRRYGGHGTRACEVDTEAINWLRGKGCPLKAAWRTYTVDAGWSYRQRPSSSLGRAAGQGAPPDRLE
jgi:hypothetical protein